MQRAYRGACLQPGQGRAQGAQAGILRMRIAPEPLAHLPATRTTDGAPS